MAFTEVTDDIERMRPPEGTALSFNAEEDVIAGQVVKIDADLGVEPSDADGETVHGIAVQTVSSGDQVMVVGSGGRVLFTAGESISAGDALASHGGTGEEGQVATAATGDETIGYALEGAGSQGDTFVGVVDAGTGGQVN
jgi:hypothetical protein